MRRALRGPPHPRTVRQRELHESNRSGIGALLERLDKLRQEPEALRRVPLLPDALDELPPRLRGMNRPQAHLGERPLLNAPLPGQAFEKEHRAGVLEVGKPLEGRGPGLGIALARFQVADELSRVVRRRLDLPGPHPRSIPGQALGVRAGGRGPINEPEPPDRPAAQEGLVAAGDVKQAFDGPEGGVERLQGSRSTALFGSPGEGFQSCS